MAMPDQPSQPAPERRKPMDVIASLLPLEGAHIVDVGCGDGSLVRALDRNGAPMSRGMEILDDALNRPTPSNRPVTSAISRVWVKTCRCTTTASMR